MRHWHLSRRDFFQDLPEVREAFCTHATRLSFQKNAIVFFEGDPGNACYYVESGLLRIFNLTSAGKEPIFFLRGPGDIFGLSEVLDRHPRKANAQALAPTVLLSVGSEAFDDLLAANHRLCRRVISVLGSRVRVLGERVSQLSTCSVMERLIKLLVSIAYENIHDSPSWTRSVTLPVQLTQEQLASMTGSTQPTINELLQQLQREGLVTVSRRSIALTNPLKLLSKVEVAPAEHL